MSGRREELEQIKKDEEAKAHRMAEIQKLREIRKTEFKEISKVCSQLICILYVLPSSHLPSSFPKLRDYKINSRSAVFPKKFKWN